MAENYQPPHFIQALNIGHALSLAHELFVMERDTGDRDTRLITENQIAALISLAKIAADKLSEELDRLDFARTMEATASQTEEVARV